MNLTQTLFILFVLCMAGSVAGMAWRCLDARAAIATVAALLLWFVYVGMLSRFGLLARTDIRPPGPVFVLGPVAVYLVIVALAVASRRGARLASAIPLRLLLGMQSFRIIVELFIHRLYLDGVVPKTLSFSGANVDIYVGISALIVAAMAGRVRYTKAIVLSWNLLGLLALANVVTRAILTTPGPFNFIHTDPPNGMFSTFPYMFIAAFFVPLAVTLHILSLRSAWTTPQAA